MKLPTFLKVIKLRPLTNLIKVDQNVRFYTKTTDDHLDTVNMSFTTYEGSMTSSSSTESPPLIVMHGLFGAKRNWNSLCKVFHQKMIPQRKIIAVDARNHGESPHSNTHSYPHLAEDVRQLCTQLDIKKASLLGHSMGGRALMYFALKYPHMVEKLIVADVSPINTSRSLNSMYSIFNAIQKVDLPSNESMSSARINCDKQLSKSISDKGLRAFLLTNLAQDSNGSFIWKVNVQALMENFSEHIADFPDVSGYNFNGSVLFVAGETSDYIQKSDHSQILKIFPKAEFQEIKGAGHWVHSDKPNEFLKICLEFLNRASSN
ncbi:hypothetical protein ILUMI_25350 [Ignelater luminosus]|uniref:sn-1-specific diacylglycerol lipase ABHD11 n=1 Tax=Ignelater luminosus TaxID=2038154 RepID=A0A8K0C8P5_IGNLU|nr:hypothetical protein ILUMI_25350 [Ignelater luminosus]